MPTQASAIATAPKIPKINAENRCCAMEDERNCSTVSTLETGCSLSIIKTSPRMAALRLAGAPDDRAISAMEGRGRCAWGS
jgi:hypothetical protein